MNEAKKRLFRARSDRAALKASGHAEGLVRLANRSTLARIGLLRGDHLTDDTRNERW